MVMAMVKIHKITRERELLWFPNMEEINVEEEIEAACEFYGSEFMFVFELVG